MDLLIIGVILMFLGTITLTVAIVGTVLFLQHKRETEARNMKAAVRHPYSRDKIERLFDEVVKPHIESDNVEENVEEEKIGYGRNFSQYMPLETTPENKPHVKSSKSIKRKCKRKT
jgi:hypothetical protein